VRHQRHSDFLVRRNRFRAVLRLSTQNPWRDRVQ